MCEKCVELDTRIARYKRLSNGFSDRQVLDAIRTLVENLKAEKAALHPDE